MAWGTLESSTQLALTGTYQTVQNPGDTGDWELTLNPGELATIMFDYNPEATPSENCDIIICATADGTLYESDGEAQREIIEFDNSENDDPAARGRTIAGEYGFIIRARLRDTDDTAGGDDIGSTLDVDIRKDGVSI